MALAVPIGLMAQTEILTNGDFEGSGLREYKAGVYNSDPQTVEVTDGAGRNSSNGVLLPVQARTGSSITNATALYVTPFNHQWVLGERFTFSIWMNITSSNISVKISLTDGIGKNATVITDDNITSQSSTTALGWRKYTVTGTVSQAMLDAGMSTMRVLIGNKGTSTAAVAVDDISWLVQDPLTTTVDGINYLLFPQTQQATVITGDYSSLGVQIRIPEMVIYEDTNYTVTTIAPGAFAGYNLYYVTLPYTLTSIGDNAFAGVPYEQFEMYMISPTPPAINSNALPEHPYFLRVPFDCVSAYQETPVWQDFSEIHEISNVGDYTIHVQDATTATITRGYLSPRVLDFSSGIARFYTGYRYMEYTIVGLDRDAFMSVYTLEKVILPPAMTTLEGYTFMNCTALSEITLSQNLTSIGNYAFSGCTSLTSISLLENVSNIDEAAFADCPLTDIYCYAATPPSVADANAFSCYNSATLHVPEGSLSAYQNAAVWSNFTNIVEMSSTITIDGINYQLNNDGTATVVAGNYTYWSTLAIPAKVTSEGRTFSVTTIAAGAFADCNQLCVIALPESLTSIGDGAFASVPTWVAVYVHSDTPPTINSTVFPSGMLVLNVKSGLNLYQEAEGWGDFSNINYIGDFGSYRLILHDDLTAEVARGSSAPTELDFPLNKVMVFDGYDNIEYTLTGIYGSWSFINCSSLTSVSLAPGMTTIGEGAFYGCTNLTNVYLPESVTTIEGYAFNHCTSLTSITLPENVTRVGEGSFNYCPLTEIYSYATTPPVTRLDAEWWTFDCYGTATLYVPAGCVEAYRNAYTWRNFTNIVEIPTTTVLIDGIYYSLDEHTGTATVVEGDYSGLSGSIIIPPTVTYGGEDFNVTAIAANAFASCSPYSIYTVTLPPTLTRIGDGAFSSIPTWARIFSHNTTPPAISSTAFPSGMFFVFVKNDCISAYEEAEGWKDFGKVYEINSFAYFKLYVNDDGFTATVASDWDTQNVTTLDFSSGKLTIFNGYQDTEYTITEIQGWAFISCDALTSVSLSPYMTTLQGGTFFGCTNLTDITIPESVTEIGQMALYGCTSLTNITIPESVASIGDGAFYDCPLTDVYCCATTPPVISSTGAWTFTCYDTATLHVPVGCVEAYQNAEIWSMFTHIEEFIPAPVSDELIVNGTFEDADISAFCYHLAGDDNSYNAVPSSFIETEGGNHYLAIQSIDRVSTNWDSQFFVNLSRPVVEGETLYFSMRAKASRNASISTQAHTYPGGYKYYNFLGGFDLTTEWQTYTYTLTVTPDMDGSQCIAFFLNVEPQSTIYYFDDMSLTNIEPDTDYSLIDNTVYLEPARGVAGGQTTLSVKMKNTESIQAFTFTLVLPEGVTVATGTDGMLMVEQSLERTTIRKTDFFGSNIDADGNLRVLYSLKNGSSFDGNDGEVVRIKVNLASTMAKGDYDIKLKNVSLSNTLNESHSIDHLKSTLSVIDVIPGDVNGDLEVDVADFTLMANYLLGKTLSVFIMEAADVAGGIGGVPDGEIDVADLTGIANIILHSGNTSSGAPRRAAAVDTDIDAMDNAIYVEPVTAEPGTQQVLSVRMKNNVEVSGLEFSLLLPEGITIADYEMSEDRTNAAHSHFSGHLFADGSLKTLCGSISENRSTGRLYTFAGNDGEVARITVNIPADYEEGMYEVLILNAKVSDADGVKTVLDDTGTSINVGYSQTTDINGLTPNPSPTGEGGDYFTLDGKKLDKKPTQKGVYILNGKKVVVK